MPKMTIRVILKSGSEFAIKCDKFTIQQNGFGQATGYNIEGITENKPVYLDFEQVAAVVRVFSDERAEEAPEAGEKRKFTEIKTKSPHCGGVTKWEDLTGAFIRCEHQGWGGKIIRIGNLIKDRWFSLEAFFKEAKEAGGGE